MVCGLCSSVVAQGHSSEARQFNLKVSNALSDSTEFDGESGMSVYLPHPLQAYLVLQLGMAIRTSTPVAAALMCAA